MSNQLPYIEVIGLPGAGKSTLLDRLSNSADNEHWLEERWPRAPKKIFHPYIAIKTTVCSLSQKPNFSIETSHTITK